MRIQELETLLKTSLNDFKLDQEEKVIFKELALTLEEEQLRFIKNKSFELSRYYINKGEPDAIVILNWLEKVLKAIQPLPPVTTVKSSAYFSPGDACRKNIISLIHNARKIIDICVFTISDNTIVKAILEAHNRGVNVTIISDNDKSNDKGSDINYLSEKGVHVILDNSPNHMHHKFAIFDEQILLNGSFNWTRSATDVNQENVLITGDAKLVTLFLDRFHELKKEYT